MLCRLEHEAVALRNVGQNLGAEAATRTFRLLAEFFLGNRTVSTRKKCRPRAEAAGHGVLSGTAHEALADFQARDSGCLANVVSAARDAPKLCGRVVLLFSSRGENAARASCLVPKVDSAEGAIQWHGQSAQRSHGSPARRIHV